MQGGYSLFPEIPFSDRIQQRKLGRFCDFARDLLEIGCYRGTAIAVPYGVLSATPLQRRTG